MLRGAGDVAVERPFGVEVFDGDSPRLPQAVAAVFSLRVIDRRASRALAGHQTEKRYQLAQRLEPAHIAELGGKGHRDQKRGAAHRLKARIISDAWATEDDPIY